MYCYYKYLLQVYCCTCLYVRSSIRRSNTLIILSEGRKRGKSFSDGRCVKQLLVVDGVVWKLTEWLKILIFIQGVSYKIIKVISSNIMYRSLVGQYCKLCPSWRSNRVSVRFRFFLFSFYDFVWQTGECRDKINHHRPVNKKELSMDWLYDVG